jgi:hypothetical protein
MGSILCCCQYYTPAAGLDAVHCKYFFAVQQHRLRSIHQYLLGRREPCKQGLHTETS